MRVSGLRQWVDLSLFVLTHTHCGLIVLLQDGGHVSRLLLFLLRIVLNQRRPLGGSAPSFLRRLARRQTSVSSSFAVGRPAAECPAAGTGLAGQLSAAVWTQRTWSERVGEVHVVQAVASRQAVSALQGRKEITRGQSVLLWRLLCGGLTTGVSSASVWTCRVNFWLKQNPRWFYPIFLSSCAHLKERSVSTWQRGGRTLGHVGQVEQHLFIMQGVPHCPGLLQGDYDSTGVVGTQHPLAPPQQGVADQLPSVWHPTRCLEGKIRVTHFFGEISLSEPNLPLFHHCSDTWRWPPEAAPCSTDHHFPGWCSDVFWGQE